LTYVIDLQRLWEERTNITPATKRAAATVYLDPRQRIVSIVMVVYQEEKLLQVLQAVLAQPFVREIIIVDCTHQTCMEVMLARLIDLHPKCSVVAGQFKMGLAEAYNVGAQYASAQFLLFLSARCFLPKNAVLKLLATGFRKPLPWIVGLKPSGTKDKNVFTCREAAFLPEVSLPGGGIHAESVSAGCLFIPAKTFVELRGMDEKCFHTTFHLDLCLRVHLAGGGVYWAKALESLEDPFPLEALPKGFRQEWQAWRGWYNFYQNYISKKFNFFSKLIAESWFSCRYFLGSLRRLL